jgi:hypothetical protein
MVPRSRTYNKLASYHRLVAAVAVCLATIAGCGDKGPSDTEQLNAAIANLSEAALDRESFESFFVTGSAPQDSTRHRYREYFYEMGSSEVAGNSATASIRIVNAAGESIDEQEWSFSKVDGKWKLDKAPLP